jgi:hypothetical protein
MGVTAPLMSSRGFGPTVVPMAVFRASPRTGRGCIMRQPQHSEERQAMQPAQQATAGPHAGQKAHRLLEMSLSQITDLR